MKNRGTKNKLYKGIFYCPMKIVKRNHLQHNFWKSFTKCKNKTKKKSSVGVKKGKVAWEGNREIVQADRDQVRKAKALTELNLARHIKGNNKIFYRYISDTRKIRKCVGVLWKEM